jgi:hypothetical protein
MRRVSSVAPAPADWGSVGRWTVSSPPVGRMRSGKCGTWASRRRPMGPPTPRAHSGRRKRGRRVTVTGRGARRTPAAPLPWRSPRQPHLFPGGRLVTGHEVQHAPIGRPRLLPAHDSGEVAAHRLALFRTAHAEAEHDEEDAPGRYRVGRGGLAVEPSAQSTDLDIRERALRLRAGELHKHIHRLFGHLTRTGRPVVVRQRVLRVHVNLGY